MPYQPKAVEEVDFPGEVFINREDPDLDFEKARNAALERAKTYDSEPMLLAWFDMKKGRHSPEVPCDKEGGDPGWVTYAKSRGGNLTVNINHGEYIFIFHPKHGFP